MTPKETRGDLLASTLKAMDIDKIELARRLVDRPGDPDAVGNKRRQVVAWTTPGANFNDTTAEALAAALGLSPETFKTPVARKRLTRAQLEAQVAAMRGLLVPLAEAQGIPIPDILREDGERAA